MGEQMTDTENVPSEDTTAAQPETPPQQPVEQDQTDWKAEARKWEQRAKENKAAAAELEKSRKASMSEAEKAVAEAEHRGRSTALTEFGQRLARADFVAAAARRNGEFDASSILDDLNLSRYVGEDGEPDTKAIAAAVDRLVPVAAPKFGNADQGPRDTSKTPDMNRAIREAFGR